MLEKAAAAGRVMMMKCGGKEKGLTLLEVDTNIKTERGSNRITAFTFVEVMVVVVTIALLVGLLLPALLPRRKTGHYRINCISNLKQIGLAMRMFSYDHGDRFPWVVPKAMGGSMEYSNSVEVFRHFLAISNELTTPKVLFCAEEKERMRASDWTQFSNKNVSYFVGLDADEGKPQTLLSGDRNLSVSSNAWRGVMVIPESSSLRVLPGLHERGINIGFGDGSAQMMSEKQVKEAVSKLILELREPPVRLAVP